MHGPKTHDEIWEEYLIENWLPEEEDIEEKEEDDD